MRIIGGEFKARSIEMPKGIKIRPTSDKVREALFNIIRDKVKDASVLDLFAGSGSLGLEALSRGAARVTFVDTQKRCIDTIKKNLKRLAIDPKRVDIYQNDALKTIKKLSHKEVKFDLVFLDPPYYGDWVKKCLIALDKYDILYDPYLIIGEHFKKDTVPEEIGNLKMVRRASYADTVLSFYTGRRSEECSISRDI